MQVRLEFPTTQPPAVQTPENVLTLLHTGVAFAILAAGSELVDEGLDTPAADQEFKAKLAMVPSNQAKTVVCRQHTTDIVAQDGSMCNAIGSKDFTDLPPIFSVGASALCYGLEMFRQSGGSLRQQVILALQ